MSKPYTQPGEKGTDTNQASEDIKINVIHIPSEHPLGTVDGVDYTIKPRP